MIYRPKVILESLLYWNNCKHQVFTYIYHCRWVEPIDRKRSVEKPNLPIFKDHVTSFDHSVF